MARRIHLSCRISSYAPFEARAYEHLASLGVEFVEIAAPPTDAFAEVEAALAAHGLRVATLHGACDVQRPDIAGQIQAQLPAFQALDCRILFASVKRGEVPAAVAYARLREAAETAAAAGVTIALETHPDLATNADEALRTVAAVDHPNLRINYDTANIYFYNAGADGIEELRKVAPFVAAVHLKDTDGGYRKWHFPALGEGIIDFAETLRVLDAAGFDGPCTLEIEGIAGEERNWEIVSQRVAQSVAHLRDLGRF